MPYYLSHASGRSTSRELNPPNQAALNSQSKHMLLPRQAVNPLYLVLRLILLLSLIRQTSLNSIVFSPICELGITVGNSNAPDAFALTAVDQPNGGVRIRPLSCATGHPDCWSEIQRMSAFANDKSFHNIDAQVSSYRDRALTKASTFGKGLYKLIESNSEYRQQYLYNKPVWDAVFQKTMHRIARVEEITSAIELGYGRCGEKTTLAALQFLASRERTGFRQMYRVVVSAKKTATIAHEFLFVAPLGSARKEYRRMASLERSGTIVDLWNGNNGRGFISSVRDAALSNPGMYANDKNFAVDVKVIDLDAPEDIKSLPRALQNRVRRIFDDKSIFSRLKCKPTLQQEHSLRKEFDLRNRQAQNLFKHSTKSPHHQNKQSKNRPGHR